MAVGRSNLSRITRLLMAHGVEESHRIDPHNDYSDMMYDPGYYVNNRHDINVVRADNRGEKYGGDYGYDNASFIREDIATAFKNRGELRKKYGHITKF